MKVSIFLLMTIIFTSCKGTSQQRSQSNIDEDWKIEKAITQKHSYNKLGLLDTTHRVEYYYVNGEIADSMTLLITRDYEIKNNLISEKKFQIFKQGNDLSNEKLFEYDAKNNLILETDKIENVVNKIVRTNYNNNNQKIKETIIWLSPEALLKDLNLDTTIALHNNKQVSRYDTSSSEFEYDSKGNLIKQFYKNSSNDIVETLTTLFSGNQKTFTFGIDPKGDTTTVFSYEKRGNLIAEIIRDSFSTETNLYDGSKIIQTVFIGKERNYRRKDTYKYDYKRNEIENVSYK